MASGNLLAEEVTAPGGDREVELIKETVEYLRSGFYPAGRFKLLQLWIYRERLSNFLANVGIRGKINLLGVREAHFCKPQKSEETKMKNK